MKKKKLTSKWKREELLEMLVFRTKENEELKKRLGEAEEKLNRQEIAINNAGSLAEAALRLSGIFEAADTAAALYLKNIRLQDEIEKKTEFSEENGSEQSER